MKKDIYNNKFPFIVEVIRKFHIKPRIIKKGYFNNAIALLLSIILGMLTYLFSMILVKGITDSELTIIKSKIIRFIPNKYD